MRLLRSGEVTFPRGSGPTLRFAAQELARYLGRILGGQFDVREGGETEGAQFRLSVAEEGLGRDEFRISVGPRGCSIEGGSERACLYGAYDFIERRLGARFVLPGVEALPQRPPEEVPDGESRSKPAFKVRGVVEDSKHVPEGDGEALELHKRALLLLIDWMGKRKLNRYFPGSRFPRRVLEELLPEFERRGIELEGGGHHIPQLLPRSLFGAKPDLFRMAPYGRRRPDGNLCPSSREALDIVAEGAVRAVREGPRGVSLYHLWPDDLPGGGWCNCPECRSLPPSDQYLAVVNHVARKFEREGVPVPVDFLAYHDTLEAPAGRPEDGVWLTFAPRERCYAHPLGLPDCPRNGRHLEALRRLLGRFPPERAVAFEYYGDSFLWGSVGVACVSTVCADLALYKALGLAGVQCLLFGPHSFWAYGPNLYAFSLAAWEGEVEPDRALREFCEALFPGRAHFWADVLRKFETAVAPFLTYADIKARRAPEVECLPAPLEEMGRAVDALRELASSLPRPETEQEEAVSALLRFTASELAAVHLANLALSGRGDKKALDGAVSTLEEGLSLLPNLPWAGLWGRFGFPKCQRAYIEHLRKLAAQRGEER